MGGDLEFKKKADDEHKEKLESRIISADLGQTHVVQGALALVHVTTAFVGNGAPIKITFKTKDGDPYGSWEDKIYGNDYIEEIQLQDAIPVGSRLYYEVECPDSGAKGESAAVPVLAPPKVSNLKWDRNDARRGDIVTLSADVKECPVETPVLIEIYEYDEDGAHDLITMLPGKVVDKKVEVLWEYEYHEDTDEIPVKGDLDPYGNDYRHPEYFFVLDIHGFRAGEEQESGILRFRDYIQVQLPEEAKASGDTYTLKVILPDGEERTAEFDEDGIATVDDIPPGRCQFEVEVEAAEEEEDEAEDEEEASSDAKTEEAAAVVVPWDQEENEDGERSLISMYLLHTDLCIQSYQFYAQSLAWPLDPWYDRAKRYGASRRDNTMNTLYKLFAERPADVPIPQGLRGPASTPRGGDVEAEKGALVSNNWLTGTKLLDPVLSRYRNIRPGFPAFQYGAGGDWAVFRLSGPLVDNVGKVYACEYEKPYAADGKRKPRILRVDHEGDGDDAIYGFEGATGYSSGWVTANTKYGNWSMMGYVMSRKSHGQGHDVHIVFRGSRSGSLLRSAPKALVSKGNPDWVTDLEHWLEDNPTVSREGRICRGFGRAIVTHLESISTVLNKIDSERGTPDRIFITGHSLGAALATCFTSAVRCGNYGAEMEGAIADWPWEDLHLMPISAPSVGSKDFKKAFEDAVPNIHRFYVKGDVVTLSPKASHVGEEIKLPKLLDINPHEPMSVRASLVDWYDKSFGNDDWDYPRQLPMGDANLPASGSFESALLTLEPHLFDDYEFVMDLFPETTVADIRFYIEVFKRVISLSSSYKSWIRDSVAKQRRAIVDDLFGNVDDYDRCKARAAAGDLEKLDEVQDDMADYLKLLWCVLVAKRNQAAYDDDIFLELRQVVLDAS